MTVGCDLTVPQHVSLSNVNDFKISARFSPGPWRVFNGVDDLVLSHKFFMRKSYRLFQDKADGCRCS